MTLRRAPLIVAAMRSPAALLLLFATLSGGCDQLHEQSIDGIKCPTSSDMATPELKCTAAKGLSGDNLFCIDFDSFPNQPLGATLPSELGHWDFTTNCGGKFWEINSGKLQIQNFGQFASMCGLLMPSIDLNQSQYKKYNTVTLSIIQRVDINNPLQTAVGALGSAASPRTFWTATGKSERHQLIVSLPKTDPVPMAAGGLYQFLFQISSSVMAGGTAQGWQIESIAVMGTQ